MIHLQSICGRKMACWVNSGCFPPDRKTLVFIHSSGYDHTNWLRQYTSLADSFNIAAVDLPGHGGSEGPGEEEVDAYAVWVKKILDGLGIVRPIMIGHSLGAAICLCFAIRYGDAAAAVIPVGGGARMPVNPLILEGLKEDPAAVMALAVKFSVAKDNRERLSDLLTEGFSRLKPEILYGDLTACDRLDIAERLDEIRIPVLILCGEQDKMTPPALSEFLRDHIAGARLSLIKGAGHFAMLENPEAFNAALMDFVNSLP